MTGTKFMVVTREKFWHKLWNWRYSNHPRMRISQRLAPVRRLQDRIGENDGIKLYVFEGADL